MQPIRAILALAVLAAVAVPVGAAEPTPVPDTRRLVRQQKSRPLAEAFERWLRAKLALISQKGKLAEAIRYALSRWEGLSRFIDDGRIELDNNAVECSIRPITLNRRNALFAGSDGDAEHWAIIASLVETCKLNDVDSLAYQRDRRSCVVPELGSGS